MEPCQAHKTQMERQPAMSDTPIRFDIDGATATITLNRPKQGNTIDMPMAQALLRAALHCENDRAIRAVVLTGTGKLFCGGGDLAGFQAAGNDVQAYISELAGVLHMAIFRLARMRKPLIGLINGPAAGAGLSLVLAGDVSLTVPDAHFSAAYGHVGLSPDGGMSWLLPRMVGMRLAQEMIIANRRLDAVEAATAGIVTRVVEAEQLADEGRALADQLAAGPTDAIGGARNLLLDSFDGPMEAHLERETRSITHAAGTNDCKEGVNAFLERRKPNFTGS